MVSVFLLAKLSPSFFLSTWIFLSFMTSLNQFWPCLFNRILHHSSSARSYIFFFYRRCSKNLQYRGYHQNPTYICVRKVCFFSIRNTFVGNSLQHMLKLSAIFINTSIIHLHKAVFPLCQSLRSHYVAWFLTPCIVM